MQSDHLEGILYTLPESPQRANFPLQLDESKMFDLDALQDSCEICCGMLQEENPKRLKERRETNWVTFV